MVELWDERAPVTEARIAAYRFYRDGLLGTHHVFDYILTDANGRTTAGTVSLDSVKRVASRIDCHGAVEMMIQSIARTPIADLCTLVEQQFASRQYSSDQA